MLYTIAHHGRDINCPDEVTLWTSGHVTLKNVGFSVDSCYFSAIILKVNLLHRPVLSVEEKQNIFRQEKRFFVTELQPNITTSFVCDLKKKAIA